MRWKRRIASIFVIVLAVGIEVTIAAEPTIDELLKRVPVLTPDNKDLTSFQFTAILPMPYGFPGRVDVGWTKPDHFGMATSEAKSRTPVLFLAQQRHMLYDASDGSILLEEDSWPNVVLQATGKRINANFGYASKDKYQFLVDLPSFFRDPGPRAKLEKLNEATWQFSYPSESGDSRLIALFEPAQTWPLRRLEIRMVEGNEVLMSVHNLSINQAVDPWLRKFPKVEDFPKELTIQNIDDIKVESAADGINRVVLMMRAMASAAAIETPEVRKFPFIAGVDWDQCAEAHAKVQPKLRSLLKIPDK